MATKKKIKEKPPAKVENTNLLLSWKQLNDKIAELTEQEALELLEQEKAGKRRAGFLLRLHGRYNVMRTARERNELLQGGKTD